MALTRELADGGTGRAADEPYGIIEAPTLRREMFANDNDWLEAQQRFDDGQSAVAGRAGSPSARETGLEAAVEPIARAEAPAAFDERVREVVDSYVQTGEIVARPELEQFVQENGAAIRREVRARLEDEPAASPAVANVRALRADAIVHRGREAAAGRAVGSESYLPARETYELAARIGAPSSADFIAERVGTPNWVVAQRTSAKMREAGAEARITPEQLRGLQREWEDEVLGRAAEVESGTTPVALKQFDDPGGEALKVQSDSIEHDIRTDIAANPVIAARKFIVEETGEEMTFDALLAELDADRAAAAALRSCL